VVWVNTSATVFTTPGTRGSKPEPGSRPRDTGWFVKDEGADGAIITLLDDSMGRRVSRATRDAIG
jgi:hypothetical protein